MLQLLESAPVLAARFQCTYYLLKAIHRVCKSRKCSSPPATGDGSFAIREKGGNRLLPGPNYMVDALKLTNQASRGSGESLQKCVAWRCPDGTQNIFCWPILAISGQSLASNSPVVDSRYLNLVFSHAEATPNK
ncbi:hypothetical protein TNCV_1847761 [Trichonephila clavipes]|nr:hypothetical protein TNCV_1847761 [Trichonephila clavipes]